MSRRQVVVPLGQCMGGWCQVREQCGAYHAAFTGLRLDPNGLPVDRRLCQPGQDIPYPKGVTHVSMRWEHRVPTWYRGTSPDRAQAATLPARIEFVGPDRLSAVFRVPPRAALAATEGP